MDIDKRDEIFFSIKNDIDTYVKMRFGYEDIVADLLLDDLLSISYEVALTLIPEFNPDKGTSLKLWIIRNCKWKIWEFLKYKRDVVPRKTRSKDRKENNIFSIHTADNKTKHIIERDNKAMPLDDRCTYNTVIEHVLNMSEQRQSIIYNLDILGHSARTYAKEMGCTHQNIGKIRKQTFKDLREVLS